MANYNTLKAAIEAVIRTNGNEEITGAILQDSLIAMINALGLGYQYMGVATADMNPGTPDQKVFYIALAAGTYTNFGGATVRQGITILKWDTAWTANELFSFAGSYTFTGNIDFANSVSISSFEEFFDELSETSLRNELDNLIPRVYSAHDGNIAVFDEYGMVTDGGKSIQDIFDEINKAAKPTGIYEKMVAGSARGILSPSAIEELFLFQRTANGAGGTGAAVFQSIKGNSIVWNQLVDLSIGSHIHSTVAANGLITINATVAANSNEFENFGSFPLIGGHKYLMRFQKVSGDAAGTLAYFGISSQSVVDGGGDAIYTQGGSSSASVFTIMLRNTTAESKTYNFTCYIQLFDITASTLSVTSVSDFTKFYNLPYYAPNPGAIKNNAATGMVTDGLNQWDEEWELGTYNSSGEKVASTTQIRCKNFIKVVPGTTYFINSDIFSAVRGYDADHNFVGNVVYTQVTGGHTLAVQPNMHYITFYMLNTYGTTYKNDICINISGPRNGQYEPHWSDTTALPITTATGKLNGEGASVVITPNGMAGVGTSFDEGIVEKGMWTKTAVRRMRVDMGSLEWNVSGSYPNVFYVDFANVVIGTAGAPSNLICPKYASINSVANTSEMSDAQDKSVAVSNSGHRFYVKDSAYPDAATFIAAMDGVMLEYPLATEQLYVLDTPVPVVARVDENGTQTILPQGVDESGVPMTAPFKASIQYPVKLGIAPIGQQSLVNLLERMKSAGKIASYTMFWDAATGVYDFTIS